MRPRERGFSAWRRSSRRSPTERPLVLVFEDLHWADDGLLDFVDHLVDWATRVPLLVVCTARPELLERRPGWGGGKANASRLAAAALGRRDGKALRARSSSAQCCRRRPRQSCSSEPAGTRSMPSSTRGCSRSADGRRRACAARDGAGDHRRSPRRALADEKTLLQDAAVVGKVFWLGSVLSIGRERTRRGRGGVARARAARSSCSARADRRSRASRSTRSSTFSCETSPMGRSRARRVPTSTGAPPCGSRSSAARRTTRRCSRRTTRARSSTPVRPGRSQAPLVERARQALREAGERAASLQAWPAAVRFYGEALELWPEDDPQLAQIRLACGRAQFSVDGTGLELVNAGVDGLADGGDPEAAAGAAVIAARIHWMVGDVERHDVYLQRALDLVGDVDDSPARVAAMTMVVAKVGFDGGYQAGLEVANEVLPDAERLGLDEERVRLLNLRGDARAALGDDGGFDDLAQSIELASQTHAFEHLHSALNNLMARQIGRGWLEQAQETLDEMKLNLERHPADAERRWINAVEAEISYTSGHWREALSMLDAFIAESEAQSPHYLDSVAHNLRAAIRRGRGERDRAVQDSAKGLEEAHRTGEAQLVGLALVGSAVTLLDEGSSQASSLAAAALDLEPLVLNDWMVVEAAWVMCDLGLAEKYRAWMARGPGSPWIRAAELVCAGEFTRAADALEEDTSPPGRGVRAATCSETARRGRSSRRGRRRASALARVLALGGGDALRARGRGASRRFGVNEARFVAAAVRLGQLGLVERADALE